MLHPATRRRRRRDSEHGESSTSMQFGAGSTHAVGPPSQARGRAQIVDVGAERQFGQPPAQAVILAADLVRLPREGLPIRPDSPSLLAQVAQPLPQAAAPLCVAYRSEE